MHDFFSKKTCIIQKKRKYQKKKRNFAKNVEMENFIKHVNIHNFKSIADLKLEDCKRINLFVGYPNVGKSNVLEALSLFSVPFLKNKDSLKKLVRVENVFELFHGSENLCKIDTNLDTAELELSPNLNVCLVDKENRYVGFPFLSNYQFTEEIRLSSLDFQNVPDRSNVKRYVFDSDIKYKSNNREQLLPPLGENIIDVLSYNENVAEVKTWMKQELKKFGLEYVLDKSSDSLKVQRRLTDDEVMQLPYSSIADTLQRLIFYKTAIASNKNSVLLFEEPEAHAFPPYIGSITQDIIDAKSNQFFIVTHSPLVVNAFLEYEKLRKETSIYLFDSKDNRTIVKRLSDEEMELAYEYGDDLLFNLENLL
jgi:AAA15 family ATPase/GTPase